MKLQKLIFGMIASLFVATLSLAQSYQVVTVPSPGALKTTLGEEWDKIDSIVVKGTINKADFETLYNCSRFGKLTVINLEQAAMKENKIPDFAFCYPDISTDYLPLERVILPDKVEQIGKYAFANMRLKKINFPSSLKKFSIGSFAACHWLEVDPLVIPEGITEIPSVCFEHGQSFRKLVLPQSLKIIGEGAFYNTRMREMNLPEGLDSIGAGAFFGSVVLRKLVIPESAVKLGEMAFGRNDSLESVRLPQGITRIPSGFLAYNRFIDSIDIPDNVTVIEGFAFQLDNLKYIRLPKKLKSIGCDAFETNHVREIVFPETLEFIGAGAFHVMEYLEKVYCMAKNPPVAELDPRNHNFGPFHWLKKECTLYVPIGSGDLYRTAEGWQDFYQIIETDNFPADCAIVFATECKVSAYEGTITVNNPSGKQVDITVYDTYGKLIRHEKAGETFKLEVAPGIYLVRTGNKTQKVMVR